MNRRTLLASVATATVATAGCTDRGETEPVQGESDPEPRVDPQNLPESVEQTIPLMESFTRSIKQYYPESSVTINRDGELYFEYSTEKSTASELETEIHQMADVYITAADGHEAVTLTILSGGVKAVVPHNTAQKRLDGDLEKDAFHETIGLMSRE